MPVKVVWTGATNGLDLKPYWIVEEVRIHTVRGYDRKDGTRQDTMVAYMRATPEQFKVLVDTYDAKNLPHGILGISVIPLIPGTVLWGYAWPEYKIKEEYTAFEVHPAEGKDENDQSNSSKETQASAKAPQGKN